jgi:hypothetical protein
MFLILLVMLLCVAIAALVVVYVAYPHRGEEVPHVPWLGAGLMRGRQKLPTLDLDHADRFVAPRN